MIAKRQQNTDVFHRRVYKTNWLNYHTILANLPILIYTLTPTFAITNHITIHTKSFDIMQNHHLLYLGLAICLLCTISTQAQLNQPHAKALALNKTSKSPTLNASEKALLLNFLNESNSALIHTIKSTDQALWHKKPSAQEWSMGQCLNHLLTAEQLLLGQVKKALEAPANNAQDLRSKDAWLISKVADRGVKVKTPLNNQPKSINQAEGMALLKKSRKALQIFLANDALPLRNHFGKSPYGPADAYQVLLVLATHSHRHHQQMLEVLRSLQKNK